MVYTEDRHGILHVGRVVQLQSGLGELSPPIPYVVSKWADWAGEVCHFVQHHPFREFGFEVGIEYWTDRPK